MAFFSPYARIGDDFPLLPAICFDECDNIAYLHLQPPSRIADFVYEWDTASTSPRGNAAKLTREGRGGYGSPNGRSHAPTPGYSTMCRAYPTRVQSGRAAPCCGRGAASLGITRCAGIAGAAHVVAVDGKTVRGAAGWRHWAVHGPVCSRGWRRERITAARAPSGARAVPQKIWSSCARVPARCCAKNPSSAVATATAATRLWPPPSYSASCCYLRCVAPARLP
jgi:hypothetical protein